VQKPTSICWQNAEVRYKRYSTGDGMPTSEAATLLSRHWAALSLHLTPDLESIIATRYDNGRPPLVVQLPLDRVGRRDGEDCILGFLQAREELVDIIARANATSQNAKNVVEIEARRTWWSERKTLDQRLAALLGDMERKWFGAFRVSPIAQHSRGTESHGTCIAERSLSTPSGLSRPSEAHEVDGPAIAGHPKSCPIHSREQVPQCQPRLDAFAGLSDATHPSR
jgi:hypothetical protein